jgi:uncharacterized protein (UPF0548 family)
MLLHQPSDAAVKRFLDAQSKLPFSYAEVGASRHLTPLADYPINHYRGKLGTGRETFDQAVAALRSWEMYNLSWTKLYWPDTPLKAGEVVAVRARHLGLWSLNACRIIYTLEEEGERCRNGFAFGTLPGHVEEGEERFTVEWERHSDAVWYELFAFARPKALLAQLGYPLTRLIQRRFARSSFGAMKRACQF